MRRATAARGRKVPQEALDPVRLASRQGSAALAGFSFRSRLPIPARRLAS